MKFFENYQSFCNDPALRTCSGWKIFRCSVYIFYCLQDELCKMSSANEQLMGVYRLILGARTILYTVLVLIANIIFIAILLKRRDEKGCKRSEKTDGNHLNLPNPNVQKGPTDKMKPRYMQHNQSIQSHKVSNEKCTNKWSEEDRKAIRTIQMACISNLSGKWTLVLLFHITENFCFPRKQLIFIIAFARIIAAITHSMKFCLYIRGKTFSESFKKRWLEARVFRRQIAN